MKLVRLVGTLLIVLITVTGCATSPAHLYSGPQKPPQELAQISLDRAGNGDPTSDWLVRLKEVDGIKAPTGGIFSTSFLVPPGQHALLITTETKFTGNAWNSGDRTRWDTSRTLSITVEQGKIYWITAMEKPESYEGSPRRFVRPIFNVKEGRMKEGN